MPMKRSGLSVVEASRVIDIEEVLEAISASGFRMAQRSWNSLRLTSSFSTAVSITRSQSASPSRVSVGTMRASALALASSVVTFLATCRDKLPLMVAMPDFSRSAATSLSITSKPASAATCAMPLPIWPEPITPTFFIMTAISSFHPCSFSEFADRLGQFRDHLIQIGHQAVIGNLKDRRILILVDRHDHLGILHAGEMLDCA